MFASKTSFPLTKELTIIRTDGQTDTLDKWLKIPIRKGRHVELGKTSIMEMLRIQELKRFFSPCSLDPDNKHQLRYSDSC